MARLTFLFLLAACRHGTDDGSSLLERDGDGDGAVALFDCDDADPARHPGAAETCNEIDDDCDGAVDEDPADGTVYFADRDGDGYGDAFDPVALCGPEDGWVTDDTDCDDRTSSTHPGAPETECADPVDRNCDGSVGLADADGDGAPACADCDDADPGAHPGAVELCNGVDDDCDTAVDELGALGGLTWHADADDDGFGDPGTAVAACAAPEGHVLNDADCDDDDDDVHPGAPEHCDDVDEDCDGDADENAVDQATFYGDADGDGFAGAALTVRGCAPPPGFALVADDCDDLDAGRYPGASERCNGVADDCDAVGVPANEADADGDGWRVCQGDCDDSRRDRSPGAVEVCDGVDNDCDSATDEAGALGATRWYADTDHDLFGDGARSVVACAAPTDHVADASDCDDDDGTVHPGASETCDDDDEDCDGEVDEGVGSTWYADLDGDGHAGQAVRTVACAQPAGTLSTADDCNDLDATAFPGATERCDGVKNDCDAPSLPADEADADGDGWRVCAGDCDDTKVAVRPGAIERCTTAYDDDCDGATNEPDAVDASAWYVDIDGDGYAGPTFVRSCVQPRDTYVNALDCDDSDRTTHPGALPRCDDLDHDCAEGVDFDADGDGWSDALCGGSDCDDGDDTSAPDAPRGCVYGTSCADVLSAGWTTSGVYRIDVDGAGVKAPFDAWCDQTFAGGGWLAVWNLREPTNDNTGAAKMQAALVTRTPMVTAITPTTDSTSVSTSNLDLSQYKDIVYGWVPAGGASPTRYGRYTSTTLVGTQYVGAYGGPSAAMGNLTVVPTGSVRAFVTGNDPSYPHVGIGFSGQIIVWGYDNNSSGYSHWGNWYDLNACCNAGNTADILDAGWRYVIYVR